LGRVATVQGVQLGVAPVRMTSVGVTCVGVTSIELCSVRGVGLVEGVTLIVVGSIGQRSVLLCLELRERFVRKGGPVLQLRLVNLIHSRARGGLDRIDSTRAGPSGAPNRAVSHDRGAV